MYEEFLADHEEMVAAMEAAVGADELIVAYSATVADVAD